MPSFGVTMALAALTFPSAGADDFFALSGAACLSWMNDVYEPVGTTADGRAYYWGYSSGAYLYYDTDCGGNGYGAMWLIDVLALRVGGEKSEEEADTVGCCSLRREHFTFSQSEGSYDVELEFLGKDSMLFKQTIVFDSENYGDNGKKVYKNLKDMCKNKRDSEEVFDQLTPTLLNQHLKTIMPGLTAKVFRTYNASETLQRLLLANATPEKMARLTEAERVTHYNDANREVIRKAKGIPPLVHAHAAHAHMRTCTSHMHLTHAPHKCAHACPRTRSCTCT